MRIIMEQATETTHNVKLLAEETGLEERWYERLK
jgi:hypothetical protein